MERIHIISLILIFFSTKIWSAQIFSWNNCIDLVSQKNPELGAAKSTVESFENLEGRARYNFFPQISGELLNNRGKNIGLLRIAESQFTTVSSETNNYSAILIARWNLFTGLKDLGGTRQADANTRTSNQTLRITKSKLSYDLKSAFQAFKLAEEYQKLTKIFIKRRQENLDIVELRYQGGMENKGSILLSKANLEQAKYDDLVAKNIEKVSRAQLAKVLGLDEFAEISIRGEVPIFEPPVNPNFKKIAFSSPYYQEAVFKEKSADEGIVIARSEFFPKVDIFGTTGKQGTSFWPDEIDRWTLGVTLTFPFFNGGRDFYGTKSAVNIWATSVSNRIAVSRDQLQKLEKAYTGFVEAVVKYKVDREYMEAAKLRAEIARRKYNNGLLIFDDWIIIENDYVTYSKNYLFTKRDRVIAEANWEYAQGEGVIP